MRVNSKSFQFDINKTTEHSVNLLQIKGEENLKYIQYFEGEKKNV
jgi:hypothetical protein